MAYKIFKSSKKEACDCTIRAIMVAEGWDWYKTYDFLCQAGRETKSMPNSRPAINYALDKLGYVRVGLKPQKGTKRAIVKDFVYNHEGIYILSLAGHVVGCKDGDYYDSWDCGNKSVYSYYLKQ